jgi:ABC-type sulfate transport system permease component
MFLKNKIKNNLISTLTIFALIFFIAIFAFSAETATIDEQLEQLKNILNSSSIYSAFQTSMLLKSAQNLLESEFT